jgi:hypothetical protein
MTETTQIRAVIFREGDLWVAQCLEFDIGVQARDLGGLAERLHIAIGAEYRASTENAGKPFSGIDEAPKLFFDMWIGAVGSIVRHRHQVMQVII